MKSALLAFAFVSLLAMDNTVAEPTRQVDSRQATSQIQNSIDKDIEKNQARNWGLRTEEWARYRQLMQGPLGVYSPHIDPLTALGVEARTDDERRRYAELQVQAEATRVEKLLAYQRTYDDAWKRLFPHLQPVTQLGAVASTKTIAANTTERLTLFVKANCPTCEQRVKQLQASGTPFDVYFIDDEQNDARLRQWAKHAGIDPANVKSRRITINHDGGRWSSLGLLGELPVVVHQVNGQWQRQ